MGWKTALANAFSGGIVQSIEKVALEAISTDMESAEAKALMVKTLDPMGVMRRDVMRFICRVYGFYLVMAVVLIFMGFFTESTSATSALETIESTFMPITGLFGTLAAASFGVNGINSIKGK